MIATLDALHLRARAWTPLHRLAIISRVLLALAFIPTGMVKLLGQRFTLLPTTDPVGAFFEAMYQTGFYWNFLGLGQVAAGMLLLIPATTTLGAVCFFPDRPQHHRRHLVHRLPGDDVHHGADAARLHLPAVLGLGSAAIHLRRSHITRNRTLHTTGTSRTPGLRHRTLRGPRPRDDHAQLGARILASSTTRRRSARRGAGAGGMGAVGSEVVDRPVLCSLFSVRRSPFSVQPA